MKWWLIMKLETFYSRVLKKLVLICYISYLIFTLFSCLYRVEILNWLVYRVSFRVCTSLCLRFSDMLRMNFEDFWILCCWVKRLLEWLSLKSFRTIQYSLYLMGTLTQKFGLKLPRGHLLRLTEVFQFAFCPNLLLI